MKPLLCLSLLFLVLAPGCAVAQSLDVHNEVTAPFDLSTYKPLDGRQRFQRWLQEDGGSPSLHMRVWMIAATSQASNAPPEWGRTTSGMARRIGSDYAEFFIGGSIHEGLAATAGTDLRYFPCGCKGAFRRTRHALEMTFVTYNSGGHKVPDLSQLAGVYGGAMIGKLWYPAHYSPQVQGVQFGNIRMGILGVIHMVQEFSPELKAAFHVRETSLTSAPQL